MLKQDFAEEGRFVIGKEHCRLHEGALVTYDTNEHTACPMCTARKLLDELTELKDKNMVPTCRKTYGKPKRRYIRDQED